MKTSIALLLLFCNSFCFAQSTTDNSRKITPAFIETAFQSALQLSRKAGRVLNKKAPFSAHTSFSAHNSSVDNLSTSHTRSCDCGPSVVHVKEGEWFFFPAPLFDELVSDSLSYYATLTDGHPLPSWITYQPTDHSFVAASKDFKAGIYGLRFVCFNGRDHREKHFKVHVESPKQK